MPMDFSDMRALTFAAEAHGFRLSEPCESEADYRRALADHVAKIDLIESFEIRFGVGWGKWTDEQKRQMILAKLIT